MMHGGQCLGRGVAVLSCIVAVLVAGCQESEAHDGTAQLVPTPLSPADSRSSQLAPDPDEKGPYRWTIYYAVGHRWGSPPLLPALGVGVGVGRDVA